MTRYNKYFKTSTFVQSVWLRVKEGREGQSEIAPGKTSKHFVCVFPDNEGSAFVLCHEQQVCCVLQQIV